MFLCTAYIKFAPERYIYNLSKLVELGLQFYCHDTTTAKTELLTSSDCQREIFKKKEIIFYGLGNWKVYTRNEAHAIVDAVQEVIVKKFNELVVEERYDFKLDEPTE